MPKVHSVKSWDGYFKAVAEGHKRFEVRKDDRDYEVGDYLLLERVSQSDPARYWDRTNPENSIMCRIICKQIGGQFGIEKGYCVLGIAIMHGEVSR